MSRTVLRRRWSLALLLALFLSRALVPPGYMPGAGGLILCPGHAAAVMAPSSGHDMSAMALHAVHHSGVTGHSGGAHDGSAYCPFGSASSPAACAQLLATAVPAATVATVIYFPPPHTAPRDTIVPTRLPRGPPTNA